VFKSVWDTADYGYIQFTDRRGDADLGGTLTIGVQKDAMGQAPEGIEFFIADAKAYLRVHQNNYEGSTLDPDTRFTVNATEFKGIHPSNYVSNWVNSTNITNYYNVNNRQYSVFQRFWNTDGNYYKDEMVMMGYNTSGTDGELSIDGNKSSGYIYRARGDPNKFIAFQTQATDLTNNNVSYGLKLGVNSLPGVEYDFAVGGKSHFNNNMLVVGDLSAQTLTGGNISITGNTISTTTGDMIIEPTGDFITIKANLTIDGSFNFNGDMIKTDTNVRVTDQLDISNIGTGPALIVTQHGAQPVATFYDDANLALIIKDGGDVSMAYNLRVEGNQSVKGTFNVSGASTFDGIVKMNAALTAASTATFNDVTTITANLSALDASFSSRVDIATDLSANNITAMNDLHVDGTIYQF